MVLGIAGKACSGKNAVASFFEDRGYLTIDVDTLGHDALELKKESVISHFGSHLINSNGKIDRKELGSIVFKDKSKLKELESIVHPAIFDMVMDILRNSRGQDIVVNAAILGPSGMDVLCDRVLWIESPLIHRIVRAIKRDRNKILQIFSRIRSQIDLSYQHFSQGVDIYMVRNRGSLANLKEQVNLFLQYPENFKRV